MHTEYLEAPQKFMPRALSSLPRPFVEGDLPLAYSPSIMFKALILPLALALPVLSCGASEGAASADKSSASPSAGAETATADAGAPKAKTVAIEAATRELRCGCKIDSIHKCGNYVAVGDEWLEISNPKDHNLNSMEWCGVPANQKTQGTVAGERTADGKIQVATLEIAGK